MSGYFEPMSPETYIQYPNDKEMAKSFFKFLNSKVSRYSYKNEISAKMTLIDFKDSVKLGSKC